ncbi:class I SAM-dependent methyltransferase [Polynucleobacter rarus]|uniref:class I SAM-dependent methyltransferase n=1 Tax=Polynucleobacter rarus TaxID=556055 RepID=UPI00131F18EC|nr:class I SAM-dependent methyltransferase [Polynucleobacter rarus]
MLDRFGTWLSRRAILKYAPLREKLNILELGCGYSAKNLLAISDKARSIVGVDIQIGDEIKSHPKFVGIEGDIEIAIKQLENQKFDLILIISVLEHLKNPLEVLSSCKELLAPDGVILINVPTWFGKFFLEYAAFKLNLSPKEEMDDHKMYYNKSDLWPLIVASGFLPSKIKLTYHKFGLNLFAVIRG